jgi:lysophospholipase L1-like esterase
MFIRQIDIRSEPIKRMVALGESSTWGYSVSRKELCWFSRLAKMLEEFQGSPIEAINQGIGSNVITKKCPLYHWKNPAALERLDDDVISLRPDFLILSYGLNDARAGTTVEDFRDAYRELIARVRAVCDPTIVILNVYYMHEYMYKEFPGWTHLDQDMTEVFNTLIKKIADEHGAIYADIYSAECGVDWFVDEDHCHANDLGHFVIANKVFEAIARNCSFVASQMPRETLINEFHSKFGNGPEISIRHENSKDVIQRESEK